MPPQPSQQSVRDEHLDRRPPPPVAQGIKREFEDEYPEPPTPRSTRRKYQTESLSALDYPKPRGVSIFPSSPPATRASSPNIAFFGAPAPDDTPPKAIITSKRAARPLPLDESDPLAFTDDRFKKDVRNFYRVRPEQASRRKEVVRDGSERAPPYRAVHDDLAKWKKTLKDKEQMSWKDR